MTRLERQARTRDELVDAAERLFTRNGFHATPVDAVADEAGYTKGAVYSNFASKEDLFLAVYERRADAATAAVRSAVDAAPDPADAIESVARLPMERRGADDGWLAVFFEFWAHTLRHPGLRDRFAEIHARPVEPMIEATELAIRGRGDDPPPSLRRDVSAHWAMQLGLQIERLTRPDVVDSDLAGREARRSFEAIAGEAGDGA